MKPKEIMKNDKWKWFPFSEKTVLDFRMFRLESNEQITVLDEFLFCLLPLVFLMCVVTVPVYAAIDIVFWPIRGLGRLLATKLRKSS